jgi:hypothetical protein
VTTSKASSPEWDALLEEVLAMHPDVSAGSMFGMPCAKAGGKAFMGSFDGGAVFSLDGEAHARALGLAGSELFDPSGRRPMKAWVVVRPEHHEVWPELAEAAWAKVAR